MITIPENAKQLKGRERLRLIASLSEEGLSAAAIGDALGISTSRVNMLARRAGVRTGLKGGTGKIGAYVPRRVVATAHRIATEAGMSPSALVSKVVCMVFDDQAFARRFLGKEALPTRRYVRKGGQS